jgi:carbamoyltransferase
VEAILGLNFSHNPSAALILDSKLICAFEEEKLRGIKGYRRFPWLSIKECVNNLTGISHLNVAVGFNNLQDVLISHRNLNHISDHNYWAFTFFDVLQVLIPNTNLVSRTLKVHLKYLLKKNLNKSIKISTFDHHLSHAASAIFSLNWDEGVCLTLDGWGDEQSGTISLINQNKLHVLEKISYLDSIGSVYSQVTRALGFKANRHEGKVMGLAALGHSNDVYNFFQENISECVLGVSDFGISKLSNRKVSKELNKFRPGLSGRIWTRTESKSMRRLQLSHNYYTKLIQELIRLNYSRENIAAGLQKFTEQRVTKYISSKFKQFNIEPTKIALAGGVFANVRLNQEIFELFNFKDIYIQPAMDDAGTALGSAFLYHQLINPETPITNKGFNEIVYLGTNYDFESSITLAYKKNKLEMVTDTKIEEKIAELIYDGAIVGVFNGNLEWGPRALGNRSILAGAHIKNMSQILNDRLSRSDFMPFAPMVLEEDLTKFISFKGKNPSSLVNISALKFMTMTGNVNKGYRELFKEVVHLDATARPQVVSYQSNPFISKILVEIQKFLGLGVIINTSFNVHETPIIESPQTAINLLKAKKIDYLYINHTLYCNS